MNIVTISDLHGRNNWQQVDVRQYDKVIFLGDYTDSYELSDAVILENLRQIVQLKQQYPDKVVLLIGNHDAQYLHFPNHRCSGFRPSMQPALTKLFAENRAVFQLAYQQGAYLFTHAGVSMNWLNQLPEESIKAKLNLDLRNLEQLGSALNRMHEHTFLHPSLFAVSYLRGGYGAAGGPVWADKRETATDFVTGLHQVVGHTPVPDFLTFGDESGSITYTDVLQTKDAFYTLEID
ncbi:metallophosphoesterase [Larkinella sp. VNQ87]|uniref:metallophosphoesterase n=1 Tax=Larkinella sp. VNQ87 TaxID=3400921 RepID=UPI003C01763A